MIGNICFALLLIWKESFNRIFVRTVAFAVKCVSKWHWLKRSWSSVYCYPLLSMDLLLLTSGITLTFLWQIEKLPTCVYVNLYVGFCISFIGPIDQSCSRWCSVANLKMWEVNPFWISLAYLFFAFLQKNCSIVKLNDIQCTQYTPRDRMPWALWQLWRYSPLKNRDLVE